MAPISSPQLRPLKRSFTILETGKRNSVLLEPDFWEVFDALADQHGQSWQSLLSELHAKRSSRCINFASFLRVYLLRASLASPR